MSYEDRFFTTKHKTVKQKARNAQCFILEKTSERACNTSVFHAFFPRHLTSPNKPNDRQHHARPRLFPRHHPRLHGSHDRGRNSLPQQNS
jgi:hypothetical protein